MWNVAVSVVTDLIFKRQKGSELFMIFLIAVSMILIAISFYSLGYIARELIFYKMLLMKQRRKQEKMTDKNNY